MSIFPLDRFARRDLMESKISKLKHIKENSGQADTIGLSEEVIKTCLETFEDLNDAIDEAYNTHQNLTEEFGEEFIKMDESKLIKSLQKDYVNFYSAPTVNPYVAIAARGPWIITSHGAVLHDNGGYGMLGMGHGPENVIQSMQKNWVMANVMTPSFSQKRLAERLKIEIGHTRGSCPFESFICMNSGSESMTVGMRISDVNALRMTGPGGRHEGKNYSNDSH